MAPIVAASTDTSQSVPAEPFLHNHSSKAHDPVTFSPSEDPAAPDASAAAPASSLSSPPPRGAAALRNFVRMSILFAANHGCAVACLGLAAPRLGTARGAAQSGVLYAAYTLSGLLGSAYAAKTLGARNALAAGMAAYVLYVSCFWVAAAAPAADGLAVYAGGAIGGAGAGLLWTAQGAYYDLATGEYARCAGCARTQATARLAGIFAFIYLSLEVLLRALSSVLLDLGLGWSTVFAIYAGITALSTVLMVKVENLKDPYYQAVELNRSTFYRMTSAWQLLKNDPKMKFMIGLNAVFGLSAAFLNSYVNGEVVRTVLKDDQSRYVGFLTAGMTGWAAIMSLWLGRLSETYGKGRILVAGSLCFAFVAVPFLVSPRVEEWSWSQLVFVYIMQGTGRSTFEGTLKAVFAEYFSYEREGAFANIILQNGLSTSVGYVMSFALLCRQRDDYCVEYRDGSLHDTLAFELAIVAAAGVAIAGYWKASSIQVSAEVPVSLNETSILVLHRDDTESAEFVAA